MSNHGPNRIVLALGAAMFLACIAAGVGFIVWYSRAAPKAIQLTAPDRAAVQVAEGEKTFTDNGGVPEKMTRKGKIVPATLPAMVVQDLPNISLSGRDFQIAPLRNGERTFSNRAYLWDQIPAVLAGWQFARAPIGAGVITVTASRRTRVYAIPFGKRNPFSPPDWKVVPDISFNYTDGAHTAVEIYQRDLQSGRTVEVSHHNGDLALVAIAPSGASLADAQATVAEAPATKPAAGAAATAFAPVDYSIDGANIQIAPLSNGEKAFGNRAYVWEKVPDRFAGWEFTRLRAGGGGVMITVTARNAVTLYAAAADPNGRLDLSGWTLSPELEFNYADRAHTPAKVYHIELAAGQTLKLPHANGSPMFVLMPPVGAAMAQTCAGDGASESGNGAGESGGRSGLPHDWDAAAERSDDEFDFVGELYGQALLIAGRDGVGLETRDQSLREWAGEAPVDQTLFFNSNGKQLSIQRSASTVWKQDFDTVAWSSEPHRLVEITERWSRDEFVKMLREQGWSGSVSPRNAGAPLPEGVEKLLGQFDELSQFSALRLTHAAIHAYGESEACLGALARAYANLSQLTRYHWSMESAVYSARALLYSQRMVAENDKSALALWHRAYVRAMVGLPAAAQADLDSAAKLPASEAPKWVELIQPFCTYQTQALLKTADREPEQAPLATMLAFLTVRYGDCQSLLVKVGEAALAQDPRSLFIMDNMYTLSSIGLSSDLIARQNQTLSSMLGDELPAMPGIAGSVVDLINQLRRPEGNPVGRETVCQQLISLGKSDRDQGEPSWAAVGRSIQETTFEQVREQADFTGVKISVDPSDFVEKSRPLVADHPYRGVIEAEAAMHTGSSADVAAAVKSVPVDNLTISALPLWHLADLTPNSAADTGRVFVAMRRNMDLTSFDLEALELVYGLGPGSVALSGYGEWLRRVAPDSPVCEAIEIRDNWDEARIAGWEKAAIDSPTVAKALARGYSGLNRAADAERVWKLCIAVAPDYDAYAALAKIYSDQGHEDQWLATMQQALSLPDSGLDHAHVDQEIADHDMAMGRYAQAVGYADSAAGTFAEWGLDCGAEAHARVGDWDKGLEYAQGASDYIGPFAEVAWCVRTGHGDRAAAIAKTRLNPGSSRNVGQPADGARLAALDILDGRDEAALERMQKSMTDSPDRVIGMRIAAVASRMKRADLRDAALEATMRIDPTVDAGMTTLARILKEASAHNTEPDSREMERLLGGASDPDFISICYDTACYLEGTGHTEGAIVYLRKALTTPTYANSISLVLAEDALRRQGIDPWGIVMTNSGKPPAATRP